MGQDATTVNEGAQVFDTALKALLNIATQALEAALVVYLPFLGLPVVRQLMDAAIGWVENIAYSAIATKGTFLIIRFETYLEKSAYLQSVDDLKKAQANGDPLLLEAANKAFADAASSLIHSDGSYNP